MGFYILNTRDNSDVPGTSLLDDAKQDLGGNANISTLKHGTGKSSHIILVPQPTDDPNDPLNWSIWYRDMVTVAFSFASLIIAGSIGPMIGPVSAVLVEKYNVSFAKVAQLTGYHLLACGLAGLFVGPLTRTYGKRIVCLVSALITFAGALWATFANSYGSLMGARVLQGFGLPAFESIGFPLIAEMYCVHQRGTRVAIFIVPVGVLNVLCPMISAVIAQNMGLKWMACSFKSFFRCGFFTVFFLIPETTFPRSEQQFSSTPPSVLSAPDDQEDENAKKEASTSRLETVTRIQSSMIPKKTYWQTLKPFAGRYATEDIVKMFGRTFAVLYHPIVWWAIITQTIISAWTIGINITLAQMFAPPPYLFTPAKIGYLGTGALIGGLISEAMCITLNDKIVKAMARANNGVFEPEFRLWPMIPCMITSVIGFFGFGYFAQERASPEVICVFYGFVTAALIFAHSASASYLTDAYATIAVESFVAIMLFKNFFFFASTFFLNDWLASAGPMKFFGTQGGIQIAITLAAVFVYIFGKRIRSALAKLDLLDRWGLSLHVMK
ncbi:MFS general substrate transporter [Cadophora sp. DSE1049]|nr:MFS general substrate transporter [Cadophora sp. DSE1049]